MLERSGSAMNFCGIRALVAGRREVLHLDDGGYENVSGFIMRKLNLYVGFKLKSIYI